METLTIYDYIMLGVGVLTLIIISIRLIILWFGKKKTSSVRDAAFDALNEDEENK